MTDAVQSHPPAPLEYAATVARRRVPLWWRIGLTVGCIYLPYAWLVMVDYPWRSYRWTWIKMWPVLPGLTAGAAVRPHISNITLFTTMGVMTAIGVALFLCLAARSRRWVPIPTLVALGLSSLNSWIAYALFRA